MTSSELLGRVVVVAGALPALGDIARSAVDAGALVAVVSPELRVDVATMSFRADPADAQVWERVGMHIEQHLGPVDGVVTDAAAAEVTRSVFGPDLDRRGHGDVVVVDASADAAQVLTRLCGRRRAAPPR